MSVMAIAEAWPAAGRPFTVSIDPARLTALILWEDRGGYEKMSVSFRRVDPWLRRSTLG